MSAPPLGDFDDDDVVVFFSPDDCLDFFSRPRGRGSARNVRMRKYILGFSFSPLVRTPIYVICGKCTLGFD